MGKLVNSNQACGFMNSNVSMLILHLTNTPLFYKMLTLGETGREGRGNPLRYDCNFAANLKLFQGKNFILRRKGDENKQRTQPIDLVSGAETLMKRVTINVFF